MSIEATSAPRLAIEDMYPLSAMQQGLLFHTLLAPGAGHYVPQIVLRLAGACDGERLRAAWQAAVDRHPSLRTSFRWEERDDPFQIVHRDAALPWIVHDWRELSPAEQEAKLQTLLLVNRSEPFDLHRPPLLRLFWIRYADERHVLVFCYHHLVLDGWSVSLLLQEVFMQYFAAAPRRLPPAPRYGQYIAWLRGRDEAAARTYWTETLCPLPAQTPLAFLGQGAREHGAATQCELDCSCEQTQALRAFAREHGLTLNSVLQGALGLVLGRYLDLREVIFGATVAGRPPGLAGATNMLGLFINTLPVKLRLPPSMRVSDWLREGQRRQAASAEFEHVSLRALQGWVNQGKPLFDCLFVFESYPLPTGLAPHDGRGPLLEGVQFEEWTHYPLTLLAAEGEQLRITAKYRQSAAADAAVPRLLEHLRNALLGFLRAPAAKLHEISLLDEEEYAGLAEWNRTEAPFSAGACLPDLLERQAAVSPDATAVIVGDARASYAELHAEANRLAHRLLTLGIGPETRVAVYLERSLAMVTALLAILKAGASYVPLDTSYPESRLAFMLEDAEPLVLIVDGRMALAPLTAPAGTHVIDLAVANLADRPASDPPRRLSPQNAAYVIYTSGSTGRPKGAINTHEAIVNRLEWMQRAYALTSADKVLQKTPLGFDVSVWEVFWPLISGASLVLAAPDGHRDAAYLAELIRRESVTTLHFVPPMLAAFLEAPAAAACTSLRHIVCSGETLSPALAAHCLACLPQAALHNLYGPTEAAIDVTAWTCTQETLSSVPIGHAIANTTIHLLDGDFNPVPLGVPGELCIGGIGLARGYLDRPALTAEKFIPNPLARAGDAPVATLLYRTGDLARRRADGALEYLGRLDHQIKLRGVRIELGEIEALLARHPAIAQALVLVREDGAGGPRLVAYVVWRRDAAPLQEAAAELTPFLAAQLPPSMLPGAYVVLDALPLTPNGKPDRTALPAPETARSGSSTPPQGATELAIAEIWCEVLQLSGVGRDDNFFELGGHSLSATRVNTRLRRRFELALPLQSLFQYPSLSALAAHLDASRIDRGEPARAADHRADHRELDLG